MCSYSSVNAKRDCSGVLDLFYIAESTVNKQVKRKKKKTQGSVEVEIQLQLLMVVLAVILNESIMNSHE